MYTAYFIIGFVTSFGWWSAGKIQKAVDTSTPPAIHQPLQEPSIDKRN